MDNTELTKVTLPPRKQLTQRQAKRLKVEFKREKKRVIKEWKNVAVAAGADRRLSQIAMDTAKEETMSRIERRVNG